MKRIIARQVACAGATTRNKTRDRKDGGHVDPVRAQALLRLLILLSVDSFSCWFSSVVVMRSASCRFVQLQS